MICAGQGGVMQSSRALAATPPIANLPAAINVLVDVGVSVDRRGRHGSSAGRLLGATSIAPTARESTSDLDALYVPES
jgi:hypothetical protein